MNENRQETLTVIKMMISSNEGKARYKRQRE